MTWTTRPRRNVDISGFDLSISSQRNTALLRLIRAGHTVTDAAPMVGMAPSSVHSACGRDPAFAAKLDQAQADARAMDSRKLTAIDMLSRGVSMKDTSLAVAGSTVWIHAARRGDPAFDNAVRAAVPPVKRSSNGRDIESQFEVHALAARIIDHLTNDGVTVAEACRREGVNNKTVSRWNIYRPELHARIMAARAQNERTTAEAARAAALVRWAKWYARRDNAGRAA